MALRWLSVALAAGLVLTGLGAESRHQLALPKRHYADGGLWEGIYGSPASAATLWCSRGDKIDEKIPSGSWTVNAQGPTKILYGLDAVPAGDGSFLQTAVIYRGYLWNNTATNEIWQFAMHVSSRIIMQLNGDWCPFQGVGGPDRTNVWTRTVMPGANPIYIYGLTQKGCGRLNPGRQFDGLALSYHRGANPSVTNAASFVRLTDGGTGRLLTPNQTKPSDMALSASPYYQSLTCAVGASIDLNGNDLRLQHLSGSPVFWNAGDYNLDGTVRPSIVRISGNWTPRLSTSDRLQLDGELQFGSSSQIIVSNPASALYVIGRVTSCTGTPKVASSGWKLHQVAGEGDGVLLVLAREGVSVDAAACFNAVSAHETALAASDEAFPNTMKGFRTKQWKVNMGESSEYARLAHLYIPWNAIENDVSDGIDKIKAYMEEQLQLMPDNRYKVIPRIYIKDRTATGVDSYFYPADMANAVDWRGDSWDCPAFSNRIQRLIARLGECWDNDPRVAWVHMGIYGAWGEHNRPVPTEPVRKMLGDAFKKAFRNKKVLVRRDDYFPTYGFGIYWDSWAHADDWAAGQDVKALRQVVEDGRHLDQPIEGEAAYDWGNHAIQPGDSPDDTLTDPVHANFMEMTIRKLHCSGLGTIDDYHPTTETIRANAARLQKAFGYRYELGPVSCNTLLRPGERLRVTGSVRNVGSAPFYYAWPFSAALLDPLTRRVVWQGDFSTDIRTWVPGDRWDETNGVYAVAAPLCAFAGEFSLPSTVKAGEYLLALAIRDPMDGQPAVRFAVDEVNRDLWHDMALVDMMDVADSDVWSVGDTVVASTNLVGTLTFSGSGSTRDFASAADVPWAPAAVTAVEVPGTVSVGANLFVGMADTVTVNGIALSELRRLAAGVGVSGVPAGMMLVSKTELEAAHAATLTIADHKAWLGISVCTNADLSAARTNWKPVSFQKGDISVSADGTAILAPIPANAEQGFMLLRSQTH